MNALQVYELASEDIEKHPDFKVFFAQEIWQKIAGLKANSEFIEADNEFKRRAVIQQMSRDEWAIPLAKATVAVQTGNASTQTRNVRSMELSDLAGSDGVWLSDPDAGKWSACSELSGYQRDGFPSQKAASGWLKRYDYGWKRRNGDA